FSVAKDASDALPSAYKPEAKSLTDIAFFLGANGEDKLQKIRQVPDAAKARENLGGRLGDHRAGFLGIDSELNANIRKALTAEEQGGGGAQAAVAPGAPMKT